MSKFTELELQQGMIIAYSLRPNQLPVQPELVWHGKIKRLNPFVRAVEVEVLDKGYEGNMDQVYFDQIIRVEYRMPLIFRSLQNKTRPPVNWLHRRSLWWR